MIPEDLEDILLGRNDVYEQLRRDIKQVLRAGIGAGVMISLTLLALKCDMNKNYFELGGAIQENAQEIERVRQNGFYIGEACTKRTGEHAYEVRPC